MKNDFAWMAQNRDAILAEWQKRYANKSSEKVRPRPSRRPGACSVGRRLSIPGSRMAHLEIRNLTKALRRLHGTRRGRPVRRARGEFLVPLGPSRCGKTTLLRAIAGLERQDAGEILHGGEEISQRSPALRDFGIVFQSYALFPTPPSPRTSPTD